jgi:predicted nuclease of predicted toxin-antitoxin system
MKFLIDECLSPELVAVAHDAGYEAYHVAHRGWSGETDPRIVGRLLDEELILVTNNRDDFLALMGGVDLHPGLIVIIDNVRRSEQVDLFALALQVAGTMTSLINKVVEVGVDGAISVYELPIDPQ